MSTLPSTPFDMLISWQTEPLAFQPPSISVYENLFKAADQEITSQPDTPSCILNSGYIPYSCSEPMMNYLTTQQDGPYFDHLNGNISHCESDDDSIISPYAYSPRMSISDDNQQVLTPDVFMPVFDFDPIVLQYAKSYEEVPSSCKVAKPDFVPLTRSNLISAQENYLSQQELKQTPIGGQGSKNKKTSDMILNDMYGYILEIVHILVLAVLVHLQELMLFDDISKWKRFAGKALKSRA
ncbi:hypothetical protein Unana1_02241 [Umbelopsis nana]